MKTCSRRPGEPYSRLNRPEGAPMSTDLGSEHPASQDTSGKGLSGDALSFFGVLTIGLASVAPAYSLAATLGYVVIETGVLAPVAVILGFLPMLLTAYAYRELNRVIPDCGTTFTWVTKAFGPRSG